MPKLKTRKVYSNYRVVVDVVPFFHLANVTPESIGGQALAAKEARGIIADIRRHVDLSNGAYFDCDMDEVCAYCGVEVSRGRSILPDVPHGCPGCCTKAQDEWLEAYAAEAKEEG